MYVDRVRIDGVRGFSGARSVDLGFALRGNDDDPPRERFPGFVVLAGRNGTGKTTLLRAVAAVLAGPEVANALTEGDQDWITLGRDEASVEVSVRRDNAEMNVGSGRPASAFGARLRWERAGDVRPRAQGDLTRMRGGRMAERSLWAPDPAGWFAAGYGPFRRLGGTSSEVLRLMAGEWTSARFVTLFREEASLAETVPWLQQIDYRAGAGRAGYGDLRRLVLDVLNDGLLPDGHVVDRVDPDGVWIGRPDGPSIRVDELSDGYRTVTALVMDIVRQIYRCFRGTVPVDPGAPTVVTAGGTVLVDEIDAHLHLSWQRRIGPWLRQHFPFVQFIVTTHSPYVCQCASENGLVRLPGLAEGTGPRQTDADLFRRVVHGSADDAVVTELFGLDSTYSQRADALRGRLTELERRALRGEALPQDMDELETLTEILLPSPSSRVRDVSGDPA